MSLKRGSAARSGLMDFCEGVHVKRRIGLLMLCPQKNKIPFPELIFTFSFWKLQVLNLEFTQNIKEESFFSFRESSSTNFQAEVNTFLSTPVFFVFHPCHYLYWKGVNVWWRSFDLFCVRTFSSTVAWCWFAGTVILISLSVNWESKPGDPQPSNTHNLWVSYGCLGFSL